MNLVKTRKMICYGAIDSTYALVPLYLPEGHWNYLRWLKAQRFDLDRFTKSCDRRRRAVDPERIGFADFVTVATDRLHQLHYRGHDDPQNLIQPVFQHQMAQAIDKTESFFRKSGSKPMRWCGWRA